MNLYTKYPIIDILINVKVKIIYNIQYILKDYPYIYNMKDTKLKELDI